MKTTVIINIIDKEENEEIETDLDFSTMVNVLMEKIPITGYETLYSIDEIVAIDLTEQIIEIIGTII